MLLEYNDSEGDINQMEPENNGCIEGLDSYQSSDDSDTSKYPYDGLSMKIDSLVSYTSETNNNSYKDEMNRMELDYESSNARFNAFDKHNLVEYSESDCSFHTPITTPQKHRNNRDIYVSTVKKKTPLSKVYVHIDSQENVDAHHSLEDKGPKHEPNLKEKVHQNNERYFDEVGIANSFYIVDQTINETAKFSSNNAPPFQYNKSEECDKPRFCNNFDLTIQDLSMNCGDSGICYKEHSITHSSPKIAYKNTYNPDIINVDIQSDYKSPPIKFVDNEKEGLSGSNKKVVVIDRSFSVNDLFNQSINNLIDMQCSPKVAKNVSTEVSKESIAFDFHEIDDAIKIKSGLVKVRTPTKELRKDKVGDVELEFPDLDKTTEVIDLMSNIPIFKPNHKRGITCDKVKISPMYKRIHTYNTNAEKSNVNLELNFAGAFSKPQLQKTISLNPSFNVFNSMTKNEISNTSNSGFLTKTGSKIPRFGLIPIKTFTPTIKTNKSKPEISHCDEFAQDSKFTKDDTNMKESLKLTLQKRLKVSLLDYQVDGLMWMQTQESSMQGGILADEMGLGKTVQSLALISLGFSQPSSGATLIVVPLSLLGMWEAEYYQKIQSLGSDNRLITNKIYMHYGPNRSKDSRFIAGHSIVLTTYNVLSSEYQVHKPHLKSDVNSGAMFSLDWERIILDEAHLIRNTNSKCFSAAMALRTKKRWCLSGTPVQNSLLDLHALLRFLRVKPYDQLNFFQNQLMPDKKSLKTDDSDRKKETLDRLLESVLLRRTKELVMNELAPKHIEIKRLELSIEEKDFYGWIERKLSKKFAGTKLGLVSMFTWLLRLRQACNHPYLIVKNGQFQVDLDNTFINDLDEIKIEDNSCVNCFDKKVCICMSYASKPTNINSEDNEKKESIDFNDVSRLFNMTQKHFTEQDFLATIAHRKYVSTKMKALHSVILEKQDSLDKIVIFSQFTSMLDLVASFLALGSIDFLKYDGTMTKKNRESCLYNYRTDSKCKVLLASLKTASLGLNLTVANHVVLIDSWWNPAVEEQAIDRVHRIGQTKPVFVTKLSIQDSVEDRILLLQERKRNLCSSAMSNSVNKLGLQDMAYLLNQ